VLHCLADTAVEAEIGLITPLRTMGFVSIALQGYGEVFSPCIPVSQLLRTSVIMRFLIPHWYAGSQHLVAVRSMSLFWESSLPSYCGRWMMMSIETGIILLRTALSSALAK